MVFHCILELTVPRSVARDRATFDHGSRALTEEIWRIVFALWLLAMQRSGVSRKQRCSRYSKSEEILDSLWKKDTFYSLFFDMNLMAVGLQCEIKGASKVQNCTQYTGRGECDPVYEAGLGDSGSMDNQSTEAR